MSARDEEHWRCFVAVPLGEPARAAVAAYLERLRATMAGVAWGRSENLHLTLEFLGDVEPARLPGLAARLRTAVAPLAPFPLRVAGVGAFPSLARPRVLWVGVSGPSLAPLADAVGAACAAERFVPDPRPRRPHVTLGRVRAPGRHGAPDLAALAGDGGREFGVAPVDRIVLFRSELGSAGARHVPVETLPLAGATPTP